MNEQNRRSKKARIKSWLLREHPELQAEGEKFLETVNEEDDFASIITRFRRKHIPDLTYTGSKFRRTKYNHTQSA